MKTYFNYILLFIYLSALILSVSIGFDVGDVMLCAIGPLTVPLIEAGTNAFGSILNAFGVKSTNSAQTKIAKENREWTSQENEKNRQWQQMMWEKENQYNTPSAQMKRFAEAGVNPLMFSQNGVSSGIASSAGAPSMSASPSLPQLSAPRFGDAFSGVGAGIGRMLEMRKVDADVANQQSQTTKNIIDALTNTYKELGRDGFTKLSAKIMPFLQSINPNESYWSKQMNSAIYNMDMDSLNKDLQYTLGKQYKPQELQVAIDRAHQDIKESMARVSQIDVGNKVALENLAKDLLVKVATIFKLKKEGEKYAADAATANAVRQFTIGTAYAEKELKNFDLMNARGNYQKNAPLFGYYQTDDYKQKASKGEHISVTYHADEFIRSLDKLFGEYIKTSITK